MSSLAALMNYVDAQKAPLDWPAFLRSLADEYRSTAGLFYHEFGDVQAGTLLDPVGISDDYIDIYKCYSAKNPWLNFLWRDPVGAFIFGEENNPLSRSEAIFNEFHLYWLQPQNLVRGIGAVLFKDKNIIPNWGVGIALLRPDGQPGIGRYSEEERERFQPLRRFMLRHIRQHPFIESRINRDRIAMVMYINPAKAGDDVTKPDDKQNDIIGGFLNRLAITGDHRRGVVRKVIEAGQRGEDALLDEVRRTVEAHEAGQATGAAAPEAGKFAQSVTRSRRASAGQQEPTAPVHADIPAPPTEAPAKYAERDNKRQGVYAFMFDAYAPWIVPDPEGGPIPVLMLPRKLLEELDPKCDQALTEWPGNHKGQPVPLKIARKNGVEPVSPEEAREARRLANRADYLRRRDAQVAKERGGRAI